MFAELLVILLVTLLFAWLFTAPLGRPGPWGGFLWFFLVLLLATWAVAAWVPPVGPVAWGVSWAPILVAALLFALLLAAVPARPPRTAGEAVAEAEATAALGVFFWFLLAGLALVILLSFLF